MQEHASSGVFRDRQFYGQGCPWSCPYAAKPRHYDNLSSTNLDRLQETALVMGCPGGFIVEDTEPIVAAFREVAADADSIGRREDD